MKKWLFISFTFIFTGLFGQVSHRFKYITTEDGLSNNRVTDFVKGKDGFVWIGTRNGLNRYDGMHFKVYNEKNSNLSANEVSDLLIDSSGRLWIATIGGGLNLYDGHTDDFVSIRFNSGDPEGLSSDEINVLFQDSNDNLWIGTENGLNLIRSGRSKVVQFIKDKNKRNAITHNNIRSIHEDNQGVIWVGTYGGGINQVLNIDGKIEVASGTPDIEYSKIDFINSIISLDDNHLLIGTHGNGLFKFNKNSKKFAEFLQKDPEPEGLIVRAVTQDSFDNLWVSTDGDGILRINMSGKHPELIRYSSDSRLKHSLGGNSIFTVYEDEKRNIWIGTSWNGINILELASSKIRHYYSDGKGHDHLPILSVLKSEDRLWLGTDGKGLKFYSFKNIISPDIYSNLEKLTSEYYIQMIKRSSDNKLWIGTFNNGLISFDPVTKKTQQFKYNERPGTIAYNDVRCLLEDENGNLWVGTWGGGLNFFDRSTQLFKSYLQDNSEKSSMNSNKVMSLAYDQPGIIWVATYGGGLELFDVATGEFEHHVYSETNSKSIPSNYVICILEHSNGSFWFGTKNGFCRYNRVNRNFDHIGQGSKIENLAITAMLEDYDGNIWLSTESGVFKYLIKQDNLEIYPELSGQYHMNSASKDSLGTLFFGGMDGVKSFHPEDLIKNDEDNIVRITGFKLFNKPVFAGPGQILDKHILYEDEIVLDYDQTVITFEFASLKYPFSKNQEYAIKMENFDADWREIGKIKTATFTNLSPGSYTFKVRSRSEGGEWNNQFASTRVIILKPFWTTWWAYMVYIVLIGFMLFLFRKYTIEWENMKNNLNLQKLIREKETELHNFKLRFFTNISHEIRTPVTLILGAINSIKETELSPNNYHQFISAIRKNGNHLLQLVNELLDFRKMENKSLKLKVGKENMVPYLNEIYLSFSNQAQSQNIDYMFSSNFEDIYLWIDRNQMEKVFYNLISNAFKYTRKGGSVMVRIDRDDQYLYVSVEDTGSGIKSSKVQKLFNRFYQNKEEAEGHGLGLSIAKEIVELHSGEILVESEVNVGSKFIVKLPLNRSPLKGTEISRDEQDGENLENYITRKDYDAQKTDLKEEDFPHYKVLVVEDNVEIRAYIVRLFSAQFEVLEASDGEEGFKQATDLMPDLVISDVMMPKMDGITLTRHLKSDIRTSHIPVVILTARTSLIYKKEGFETGADEYVTKPFNEPLLYSRVKNLLRNRSLIRKKYGLEILTEPRQFEGFNNLDQKFLDNLINIVEDHIEFDLKADFIAKEIGMSHTVVYKKIKSLTGLSLVEFVRDYRLKKAARLIKEFKLPVTEACFKVGFNDRRYFTQAFKKKFGVKPSEYHQESTNNIA